MKNKDLSKLDPGLYEVHWKSGGISLASVGATTDGRRWLAPINWSTPTLDASQFNREVEQIVIIRQDITLKSSQQG